MTDKNPVVVYSAEELTLNFPVANRHLSEDEAGKTRSLLKETSIYTPDSRVYIKKDSLPHLMGTDKKGVNRFYNDLNDIDKIENGSSKYASVEAVNKEFSKRLQEPRDAQQRERIRDSEKCINALRDAPELEKIREIEESKNRKEQPRLKAKKMKLEGITNCQLTGELLENDAHAHHIERRADKPRLARDLNNIVVANQNPHDEVHRENAESREELKKLCEKKGWNDPT
jgi:acylphosphatase